ncbi:unnamed protein product [Symbiodinium natans]|uniref:Uncharacterized protein n=1 Tax=Symbiodinium natans TaxID=878477 RepID=A0A812U9M6_9DINO|nr:unnamed protein product [Symbiodinium natans]
MMEQRVPLPGESAEGCRKRVMAECRRRWHSDQELRDAFSERAKSFNQEERAEARVVAATSRNAPEPAGATVAAHANNSTSTLVTSQGVAAKYVPHLAPHGGFGCLGLGDRSFGISKMMVKETDDATTGFVQRWSNDWRRYVGGICEVQVSRKKKNMGPNVTIRHPFLVAGKRCG